MRMREVDVALPRGVHARVAAQLTATAASYSSSVFLRAGRSVSLADTMAVLGLGIAHGDRVMLLADGRDGAAALEAVAAMLESVED
ncbi:HPr family phosphocarrier protein [Luteococcus sp.]|uniref:HPr family phosphocarrier protein n=1 Tax=Luteococcus sp. TaxID=1969402 RepID=UPI003735D574